MVFGRTVPDLSLNAIANLGYAAVKFLSQFLLVILSPQSPKLSVLKKILMVKLELFMLSQQEPTKEEKWF